MSSSLLGFDMIESRSAGLGRTVHLADPTAAGLTNAPSDRLEGSTGLLEAGYHRRFELADLDNLFLAGAYRHRRLTLAFAASQFGHTDLYAEQLLKGSLTYHWRSFSLAASLSALQIQIGHGYGGLRAATVGLGAFYSRSGALASLAVDNLTRPRLIDNGLQREPTYTLLAQIQGRAAYSFTGRIRSRKGQKPQLGLGQIIRLHRRSSFFWGVGTEPLEYGGGIEINVPLGSITYAASVHPVLGLSHTVTISYRLSHRTKSQGDDFD